MKNNTAIYSIKSVCKLLKLSRGQFWNLQKEGIFPECLTDSMTGRHYFNEELKDICLQVRKTGIGVNNCFHLFYDPRQNTGKPRQSKPQNNTMVSAYLDTLRSMGIADITAKDINAALTTLYQDKIPAQEGVVVRDLYRYFRNSGK